MNIKSTFRLIVSEISAVAINMIPLALWFFEDYSSETTMVIYALECAAAILFAVLCVLVISPSYDPSGTPKYRKKSKLIADFLVIALALLAACFVFLGAFIFLVLKATIDLSNVRYALMFVLAFQLVEFLTNLITLRPLPLRKAEFILTRSLGRTALLFLGVFLGVFFAAFVNEWFVVPFIALKTLVDIGEPIQYFLGKGENEVSLDGITS